MQGTSNGAEVFASGFTVLLMLGVAVYVVVEAFLDQCRSRLRHVREPPLRNVLPMTADC